jgi:hypothetical protein
LIKREEFVFSRQSIGLRLLKEAVIEARSGREIVFEELVEKPWMAKGNGKETMTNFFDMKSGYVREYVDGVIARIKRDLAAEENKITQAMADNTRVLYCEEQLIEFLKDLRA